MASTSEQRGRQDAGSDFLQGAATMSSAGFVTPRSRMSAEPFQNNWMGIEVPRWMSRLGAMLNIPSIPSPGDYAPSPLLEDQAATISHGGHAYVLSPPRRRPPRPPSPPTSSSIPQEAIQAEVQRQFGGLLERLQQAEGDNQRLREQLQATARSPLPRAENTPPPALLGNLMQMPSDPGLMTVGQTATAMEHPMTNRVEGFAGATAGIGYNLGGDEFGQLQEPPQGLSANVPEGNRDLLFPRSEQGWRPGLLPSELPGRPRDQSAAPGLGLPEGAIGSQQGQPQSSAPGLAADPQPQPGLFRTLLGGRTRTPSPPPTLQGGSPVLDALTSGMRQLQELQAQALARGPTTASSELVKPGTTTLSQLPEPTSTAESALKFQDWVEVTGAAMADVSEQSATWWASVTKVVEDAYNRWLAATPLERLNITVTGAKELTEGRWVRVNARVSTMLLGCMQDSVKMDMISRRISQSCPLMMYRLYTYFQPGGPAERHDLLRRLQSPSDYCKSESLEDVLQTIRNWPRWLSRCRTVNMVPPDASVLAKGLMALTTKHISSSGDSSFRTSMLRTSLRLDGQPSLDQVLSYQRHLQAELEMMSSSATPSATTPAVRAVDTSPGGSAKPKFKDKEKEKGVEMCRYFMKPSGCKRGSRCVYSHSMQNMDRELRAKKCLACGSEAHRQRDCPVTKPQSKAGAPTHPPGRGGRPEKAQDTSTSSPTSSAPTVAAVHGSSTAGSQVVEGTPWTLEALVQAAHQVVQQQQGGSSAREGETSPEKTRAEMKMLVVKDIRVCSVRVSSMALLDSGATHCLRAASTRQEWEEAEEVKVQLAGTHTYGSKREHAREGQEGSGQTIVPIGQLVNTLGYSLHWTPTSCYLQDSNGIETVLKVKSGCPQLQEVEALSLIARIEERKKEHLENETLVLQDKVEVASRLMEKTWEDHLRMYAQNGKMGDGLRALRDAPFLDDMPCECLCGLVPADVEDSGWEILKELSFLNRSQRRRLLLAKRWVVHLFAGEPGHWEVFKLDQHGTVVLELDIHRCRGQDIYRPEVWRALVWAARMGKVDVVMGGPPGRQRGSFGHDGVLPDDLRPLSAVTRMVWLHAVSEAGRLVNGPTCEKRRPVGFVIEHPEHEVEVIAHPSGSCIKPDSIWTTSIWKSYSEVGGLRMASFDQGMMGSNTRNPTTLGTNVDHLLSLHELRQPEGEEVAADGAPPHVWSPGMVGAVVIGLTFWDRGRHQYPMVRAMTP